MFDFIKVDKEKIQDFIKELLSNNVVNPLNSKLESILTKIENSVDNKKVIEDLQKDKTDLISKNEEMINSLKSKDNSINRLSQELEKTKNDLTHIENEKRQKEEKYNSLSHKFEEVKSEKELKEEKIRELEKTIIEKDADIEKAIQEANKNESLLAQYKETSNGNFQKIEEEKTKLQNEINEKNIEAEEYKNKISIKSQKITELNDLNNKNGQKISELQQVKEKNESEIKKLLEKSEKWERKYNSETADLKNEISTLENEIRDLKKTKDILLGREKDYLNTINIYTDTIKTPYKNLYEKILNCKSLKVFKDEQKLTDDKNDLSNYEKLIKLIGKEYFLAKEIQISIEKEKIVNQFPMTNDERELYDELNNYYKNNKGITFDIVYFPKTEKFDKVVMRDIKEPRGDFNKWVEIYIPAIQEREGTFTFKALVKGSK